MWLAALVCLFAPLKLSQKATSTTSIRIHASSAVLAQKYAPARLSSPGHDSFKALKISDEAYSLWIGLVFLPVPFRAVVLGA